MRWLINYLRSCFCKHEWELIFDGEVGLPGDGFIICKATDVKSVAVIENIKVFKTNL